MATQIAAQMYTVREFCKTPADIAKTCQRLAKIGYQAVQPSALGPIDVKDLAKILQDNGLACAATHVPLDMMKDTDACVAHHQALGCKYTAIGGFFPKEPASVNASSWADFAAEYSSVATKLAAKGLRAGYHNHSHELAWFDGRPALDILIEKLDPSVWFEIDTYWIAHGGGDPAAWIEKCAGRLPCVHFKDMSITIERQQKMSEVGSGNLNWPRILEACRKAGVEWYIVERDAGDLDAFESLKISLENLKGMGLH